ncbi:MAG: DUF4143 domain-containing protein [Bifidobacteriaceae bacterium]|nr:DUF4143 domain-containing protein [Bifidobacteriaceae bacterium]
MGADYVRRLADDLLDGFLVEAPAVALAGPKAVGKTATAARRARTVFELDDSLAREAFLNAARPLEDAAGPILIDEWQHVPDTWNQVRRLVDRGAAAGRFLLAGSAEPRGAAIHSGAGRILSLRLRPLSLAERQLGEPVVSLGAALGGGVGAVEGATDVTYADYAREIVASGFPGIRRYSAGLRVRYLDTYVTNAIGREFAEQGLMVRRPEALRAWLRAYAAATGTTASYSGIVNAATPGQGDKPAASTTIAYREVLQSLWLLDEVAPWDAAGGSLKRLAGTPKHFLADPALAARLLGLDEAALVGGAEERAFGPVYGSIAGRLFEALLALSLQTYADANDARLSHLRTQDGAHEVDFIVERGQAVVAVEVKLSRAVRDHDVRHLVWLRERLGERVAELIIVTTGPTAYRRRQDGVLVVPAALLGA